MNTRTGFVIKTTIVYCFLCVFPLLVFGQIQIQSIQSDDSSIKEDSANLPAAVPVLTMEEAEKANKEALELYQKMISNKGGHDHKTANTNPAAVPVLSAEKAQIANAEALRFHKKEHIKHFFSSFWGKNSANKNLLCLILSFVPLLLIADVLIRKRSKSKKRKSQYFSLSRRIYVLASVSLLVFGIYVFVPWSVYFGNSLQFQFIFQDFVCWNLLVLTTTILCTCIILLLIPPMISDYLVAIIAGLGLCVYIQAMFMNQHLGTMDGNEPAWSEHRVFGIINIIIWLLIVSVPIVLKKLKPVLFQKVIAVAAGLVLFLEVIATVSMVFSASQDVWVRTNNSYYADGSKQFELSKEKNVILFVFDAMGSNYVKLCFESFPEAKKIVKDFIWYDDARSNYTMTFPGFMNELTGSLASVPTDSIDNFYREMWGSKPAKSFYRQIREAGYDARIFCHVASKYMFGPEQNYCDYFSNIEQKDVTYEIDYERIYSCLRQMSGFSCMPFLLKQYYFYDFSFSDDTVQIHFNKASSEGQMIPRNNFAFLNKMVSSGVKLNAEKPVFAIYYTIGSHLQWLYDEKCNKVDTPFDNPAPTTRGCIHILSEFIRLLKSANIYDNTAIIVCSDHGGGSKNFSTPFDMTFMVKPFFANKTDLTIDRSKVQSIDVLPTLLDIICGDKADYEGFEGYSSFKVPNERVRKSFYFVFNKDFPSPGTDFLSERNCFLEYDFTDINALSKSYVRQIPFLSTSKGVK